MEDEDEEEEELGGTVSMYRKGPPVPFTEEQATEAATAALRWDPLAQGGQGHPFFGRAPIKNESQLPMQPPQQELGQLPQLAHTMAVPPGHEQLAQQIGYTPVAQPQQPYEPPQQQLSASTTEYAPQPPPPHQVWSTALDAYGRTYYWNEAGESTYDPAPALEAAAAAAAIASAPPGTVYHYQQPQPPNPQQPAQPSQQPQQTSPSKGGGSSYYSLSMPGMQQPNQQLERAPTPQPPEEEDADGEGGDEEVVLGLPPIPSLPRSGDRGGLVPGTPTSQQIAQRAREHHQQEQQQVRTAGADAPREDGTAPDARGAKAASGPAADRSTAGCRRRC